MRTTIAASIPLDPAPTAWGPRSASLALHLGLVALAVWATAAPPPADQVLVDTFTTLTFNAAHPAPKPAPASPHVGGPAGPVLTLPAPGSAVLPPLDVPPMPGWAAALDPFAAAPASVLPPDGPPAPAPAAPLDLALVEEPPVLLSHPAPGYPELLRTAGIEGRVVLEAVVDTAGRVERGSLRVVSSTHALFVPEASALVMGSRYRPARFGGAAVRVRIQVPVIFALKR